MDFELYPNRPSPAPRERVPTPGSQSGGRRVRVAAEFIYRRPVPSIDAEPKSPPFAARPDRRRAADVVGFARSAARKIQIPATASDKPVHRRFCRYAPFASDRNRRSSTCRQRPRPAPNSSAGSARLEGDPFLEQRCPQQYQRGDRNDLAGLAKPIDPHLPSPLGWAPPSPAARERGFSR